MITVYGYSASGNCHKLRLLLTQLERDYRWVEIDSARGETRTERFLARNPAGKVPLLELDNGEVLNESNAILYWLAAETRFFAGNPWQRAKILSWMFFEQYTHEPAIAVARFIHGWTPLDSPRRAELPGLIARGAQALAIMENHLQDAPWFSGRSYGIGDIALFPATDVAPQGGFDLQAYSAVRDWLARVRATPGFIAMPDPPPAVAALFASSPN